MRRQVRRQGLLPPAFATLLSVAAGLSLAEEHIGPMGAPAPATHANNLPGMDTSRIKPKPQRDGKRAPTEKLPLATERGTDEAGTGDGGQTKSTGVGSRALMGNEAPDAANQPEMATGVDLKGAPVRFPAGDTPE